MKTTEVLTKWAATHELEPRPAQDGEKLQVVIDHELDGTAVRVFVEAADAPGVLQVYVYPEPQIPLERLNAVERLVALINPALQVGGYELAGPDRVRFRTGTWAGDEELAVSVVDAHVATGLNTLSQHLFAFIAVMHAGAAPKAALAESWERYRAKEEERPPPELKLDSPWLVEGVAALDWAMFNGTGPIREWAASLRSAPAPGSCGRSAGIFLVGPSLDACEDVARLAASEARYRFACIPAREQGRLRQGALTALRQLAPVMVFLGPGTWQLPAGHVSEGEREKHLGFHEELLRELRAFDPAHPVVYVTAVPATGLAEERLAEVGAFDQLFAVPDPTPEAVGRVFLAKVGEQRCGTSLRGAPAKVGKIISMSVDSRQSMELAALTLRRLHEGVLRPLEFVDLLDVLTRGMVERADALENPEAMRWNVAVHEAGHASVAVLDSDGENVPEFSTIVPTLEYRGVVVSSTNNAYDGRQRMDYATFRHAVRVSLAGRAAEELVFGPGRVSSGASSDLEHATRRALQAFSDWGFAPGMSTPEASRSNLAVTVGPPTAEEQAYTRGLVRKFLADEYEAVLGLLAARRPFLEAVANRLLVDPVVDQGELTELCVAHGVRVAPAT